MGATRHGYLRGPDMTAHRAHEVLAQPHVPVVGRIQQTASVKIALAKPHRALCCVWRQVVIRLILGRCQQIRRIIGNLNIES